VPHSSLMQSSPPARLSPLCSPAVPGSTGLGDLDQDWRAEVPRWKGGFEGPVLQGFRERATVQMHTSGAQQGPSNCPGVPKTGHSDIPHLSSLYPKAQSQTVCAPRASPRERSLSLSWYPTPRPSLEFCTPRHLPWQAPNRGLEVPSRLSWGQKDQTQDGPKARPGRLQL
jgi:hypothetical protein